jgi:CYTH domain-containing protein
MSVEIERKFVVCRLDIPLPPQNEHIRQGYLAFEPEVRVRISGGQAVLTVKGSGDVVRSEVEVEITPTDAERLLKVASGILEKRRYRLGRWLLDIFEGPLTGLRLLEIELSHPDEAVSLPAGVVAVEVTRDPRFKNKHLVLLPDLSSLSGEGH